MEGRNLIKSAEMALTTFFAQTGVGIIILPSILARQVGHDGWISVIITGMVISILGILSVVLLRRYRDKAIYDINPLIFGKYLGFILNLLLLLYLATATVAGASLFSHFIRITLL